MFWGPFLSQYLLKKLQIIANEIFCKIISFIFILDIDLGCTSVGLQWWEEKWMTLFCWSYVWIRGTKSVAITTDDLWKPQALVEPRAASWPGTLVGPCLCKIYERNAESEVRLGLKASSPCQSYPGRELLAGPHTQGPAQCNYGWANSELIGVGSLAGWSPPAFKSSSYLWTRPGPDREPDQPNYFTITHH